MNRPDDVAGIGIAYLDDANKKSSQINNTTALEVYYKHVFSDYFDLTIDAQWIEDNLRQADDPEGVIAGLRFNTNF